MPKKLVKQITTRLKKKGYRIELETPDKPTHHKKKKLKSIKPRIVQTEWGPVTTYSKLKKRKFPPVEYPISKEHALRGLRGQMKTQHFGKTRQQAKNNLLRQWTELYYNEEISEFTYRKIMEEIEDWGKLHLKKR